MLFKFSLLGGLPGMRKIIINPKTHQKLSNLFLYTLYRKKNKFETSLVVGCLISDELGVFVTVSCLISITVSTMVGYIGRVFMSFFNRVRFFCILGVGLGFLSYTDISFVTPNSCQHNMLHWSKINELLLQKMKEPHTHFK